MKSLRGMLTLKELQHKVEMDLIDTIQVVFVDLYGRFMGKRYDAEFFLESALDHGSHSCNYLLATDMEMEPTPGYEYSNWEKGYGDFRLQPDLATLRQISWLEKTALIICDVVDEKNKTLVPFAPRSILKNQLSKGNQKENFTIFAASELEYYLLKTSYGDAARNNYQNLVSSGWYIEDYHMLQGTREEGFHGAARRHLRDSGVPVETSKGEWGVGQHELNIRYSDVLTMSDRHSVYKQCLKELSDQMGRSVTFMAKFDENQAGSSCHIHISLWKDGKNCFIGDKNYGPVACSDLFRWFLGGWLQHTSELMVFYAPTVNSYKRYQSGSWAPTRIACAHDNRTAGFRIVGSGESLRIECRIPGADCNPYLAFAAAIASGLDGIENRIEPPDIFEGDLYNAEDLQEVPKNFDEAISLFQQSTFATQMLGEKVKQHYIHFFQTELNAYERSVTDWERKRYFERI